MSFPNQVVVQIFEPSTPFGGVQVKEDNQSVIQVALDSGSPIQTVFGRIGDIQPLCSDYALCYAPLAAGIPAGGAVGEVLSKLGPNDYDAAWTTAGAGSVTNFSAGTLSPLFTTSVANPTSTPALSFALSNAGAHQFLGNNTGASGAPAYVQPAFSDLSGQFTLNQTPSTTASVLIGRGAGSGNGIFQEITLGTNLTMSGTTLNASGGGVTDGDKGDIVVSSGGTVWTIDTAVVTYAKIQNVAALSVFGRSSNSSGVGADITAAADFNVLRRSGTSIGFGAIDLSQAGAVTGDLAYSNLAQGSARSVLGVTGNATADVASIQGTTDQVLVINGTGTALSFGTVATGGITNAAVTYAKIQNVTALSVFGRASNTTGVGADIVAASDFQVLRRSGTSIGFGAIDLSQAGAVTGDLAFSNLAQGSARSVLGVTGNATADVASIQGTTDQVLVVNGAGNALAFSTVATGGITNAAVTYAKIQNVAAESVLCRANAASGVVGEIALAASQLLGRGATGDVAAITLGSGLSMTGATLNVTAGGGNVSNSGTPANTQAAFWTDATHIQGTSLLILTGGQLKVNADAFLFGDTTDPTKQFRLNVSAIATGTTRTMQIPDSNNCVPVIFDVGAANNFLTGVSSGGVISKARPTISNLTDLSAVSKLIGSGSASGVITEITLGTNLSMSGNTLNATGGGGLAVGTTAVTGGTGGRVFYETSGNLLGEITNATSDGTTMTLTDPKVISSILDTNGNKILALAPVASAVNYLSLANADATGTPAVSLSALGTNAAINIDVAPKAGALQVKSENAFSGHVEALRIYHNRTAGGLNGLGTDIIVGGQTTTTPNVEMGGLQWEWINATHASRTSQLRLAVVTGGVFTARASLFASGGLSVRTDDTWTIDPGGGFISTENGYKIGSTNIFPVTTANGGVPSGGTTSQVLQKNSNTNYDVGWTTLAGGGNVSNSGTPTADQTAIWTDATHIKGVTGLLGGSTGQVLKKNSATDYDWSWGAVTAGAAGADTQIQFNDGGTNLGADSDFLWNKTTNLQTINVATAANTASTNLLLQNLQTASAANHFYSPGLTLTGTAWASASSTSRPEAWRIYGKTQEDGANGNLGTSFLTFAFSENGGAFSDAFAIRKNSGQTAALWDAAGNNWLYSNNAVLSTGGYFGWSASGGTGALDTGIYRNAGGVVEINNGTAGQYGDILTRGLRSNAVTFANRIAAPVEGTLQSFTDSSTNTQGATITGGGSNHVIGYYNGTNWIVASGAAGAGGGNVTTSATLSSNTIILGNGGVDIKVSSALSSDGNARLILGDLTTVAGSLQLNTSTANALLLFPPTNPAATVNFTFPAVTTNLQSTGGANHVLKQTSAGGAITSGQVAASEVSGLPTFPSGTIVGTSDTQTLTNKRINPRTHSVASATSWTPAADSYDEEEQTALAGDITVNAPSGTPVDGQKLILRIKSNSSSHNFSSWNAIYVAMGVTLPTTIAANKTIYAGCIYNSNTSKWDVVAVATEA